MSLECFLVSNRVDSEESPFETVARLFDMGLLENAIKRFGAR